MKKIAAIAVTLCGIWCPTDRADELQVSGYGPWMPDDFAFGTRITHFVLMEEDDSSGFLGSIDHLGDEQDYAPYKFYAQALFTDFVGVEVTWDRVAATATTSAEDNHTDGEFSLEGPILTVFGQYPNDTAFTPFAGAGAAFYSADFDAETWWANGWASPADFEAAGSPPGPRNGKTRELDPEDSIGLVVTAGVDYKITEEIHVDLYVRYTDVSTDTEFTISQGGTVIDDNGTTSVPFDNVAAGLGAKMVF